MHEKAIRIYDQNFIVADKKIALMEIHLKEIYKKIETLGKAITNLSDVLISEDTKKEKIMSLASILNGILYFQVGNQI